MMPFNDAEDVVDKDDLNTQKQLLSTEDNGVVKGSAKSKSSDVRLKLTRERTVDLHQHRAPALISSWPSNRTSPACRSPNPERPFPSPDF
ncbi:hypothetical protein DPMN_020586 [Dreissena polymorpha]|uniref:Uncharacterized protein n=1 Tax=Dreissena polymorpha TaxID=45954 RepID=A0A9D4NME7_DREPO|nr:hypothetical protein DPMN_020586 [Dreissena polymorpha]